MIDQHKRDIRYLRISVTDSCNLRCVYCMPKAGISCVRQEELLTDEEILRVVKAGSALGIEKIKITGGEPLVRKGITDLVKNIKGVPGIKEVTMTTNGILLKNMAEELKEGGLDAINISLDTLDKDKYKQITRFDKLNEVLLGIDAIYHTGIRTKINCVPIKGINEEDIIKVADYANRGIDVRFIEMMPLGLGKDFEMIPALEVIQILEKEYGKGERSSIRPGNGPAIYYNFKEVKGNIGFISAMTHEICEECNRIRMTAEGDLKLCLYHNKGVALKPLLRKGVKEEELIEIMGKAVYSKPNHHCFNSEGTEGMDNRKMVQIGG